MRVESIQWHITRIASETLWMKAVVAHTFCLKMYSLTALCANGLWSADFAIATTISNVVRAANDL